MLVSFSLGTPLSSSFVFLPSFPNFDRSPFSVNQENTGEVRLTFVHNPPTTDAPSAHPYSISNVIPSLVESGDFSEVYPNELLAYLDLNASPSSPPKRSLDDQWTNDNPLTPFVEHGATEEEQAKALDFWQNAETFAYNAGIPAGASAVILNGRVRSSSPLPFPSSGKLILSFFLPSSSSSTRTSLLPEASTPFTSTNSSAVSAPSSPLLSLASPMPSWPTGSYFRLSSFPLHRFDPSSPTRRRVQADTYAFVTSIIASSGVERKVLSSSDVEGLP
jgi:hypothetical protein